MGATVIIASRNGEKCEEFAAELRAQGYNAVGMALDLSNDESIKQLAKNVYDRYGKIDILVNCIAPGGFNPGLADDPKKQAFQQTYIENCPLGCWAIEDDIKGPVVFLASEAANYVTGATLVMDGGWTIW